MCCAFSQYSIAPMKKPITLILGLLTLAFALTTNVAAQTIGGDTALTSKTWTWTGLSAALPSTTLFTPTVDSDFIITIYGNATITSAVGGQICVEITWTDELFTNTYPDPNLLPNSNYCIHIDSMGVVVPSQSTIPIHVLANTSVSVSTLYAVPSGTPQPTYNLVISKVKVNP